MFAKKNCLYLQGEKEYSIKNQLMSGLGYRLDHKLLFGPHGISYLLEHISFCKRPHISK